MSGISNNTMKWNIGWGTVSLCNMNCEFCYSKSKRKREKDLGFTEWKKFIDENHELINSINYGTGENSLSEEWFILVDYIRKNYPSITQAVTTNGYISEVISKDNIKREIINRAIDEFDISLDYARLDIHNKFRGQKNAGKWAINTLEYCYRNNKEATIVCLGSKKNMYKENVDGLFKIAERFNAKVRINMYRPTDGVNEFSKQFIWEPGELIDMLKYINGKYKILAISDSLISNIMTDKSEEDPSGIDSIRILPDGSITPSTYLIKDDYVIGSILNDYALKDLEHNEVLRKTVKEIIPEECKDCKYCNKCKGGVIDRRYLWHGTLERKDPYCVFNIESMEKIHIAEEKFKSVHYGYLPTMFFLPNE